MQLYALLMVYVFPVLSLLNLSVSVILAQATQFFVCNFVQPGADWLVFCPLSQCLDLTLNWLTFLACLVTTEIVGRISLLAQVESVHLLPYPLVDWGVLGVVGDDQRSSKFRLVLLIIVLSVSLENEITSVKFQYFFKLDFNDLFRVFLVHELFSQIFEMNFSPIIS